MKSLAALAAVAAAVVTVPGGVVGGTAACAAEDNRFAIVVDFGDAPSAPSANTVTCVPVDGDDTAADALATRARMLGRPGPRYNNAGLLCSLDGFPESGCGDRTEAGYRYWSYWFGGDKWSYASTGPAFHRAKAGGVIGWRFQPTGTATASDPPPRASARFADLCPPVIAASTPPTSAAPRSQAPTTAPTTAAPVGSPTSAPTATSTTTSPPPLAESSSTTTSIREEDEAGEFAVARDGGGEGEQSSWPVAAGGVAVAAAIGGAAVMRARRR